MQIKFLWSCQMRGNIFSRSENNLGRVIGSAANNSSSFEQSARVFGCWLSFFFFCIYSLSFQLAGPPSCHRPVAGRRANIYLLRIRVLMFDCHPPASPTSNSAAYQFQLFCPPEEITGQDHSLSLPPT